MTKKVRTLSWLSFNFEIENVTKREIFRDNLQKLGEIM